MEAHFDTCFFFLQHTLPISSMVVWLNMLQALQVMFLLPSRAPNLVTQTLTLYATVSISVLAAVSV